MAGHGEGQLRIPIGREFDPPRMTLALAERAGFLVHGAVVDGLETGRQLWREFPVAEEFAFSCVDDAYAAVDTLGTDDTVAAGLRDIADMGRPDW